MIAYLKGKIQSKGQGFIILNVGDVGYKVFVNEAVFAEVDINQEIELYTYQHVREDILALFGFFKLEQLEIFEMLLSVSGIGPKSALGVIAVGEVNLIKEAIASGDSSILTKVSGIGKKTAERVVMELKDKMGVINISSVGSTVGTSADEIDALMALGYSMQQARDALKGVDPKIKDSGERIKMALKNI
ncbi:Holliday junction branch migration protein RuvA [Candidatus Parcubacteria bacterium]|nr:MAG: Holliday junction branch migration protein RuvA [Candidatus Parcubacteria bacterium]